MKFYCNQEDLLLINLHEERSLDVFELKLIENRFFKINEPYPKQTKYFNSQPNMHFKLFISFVINCKYPIGHFPLDTMLQLRKMRLTKTIYAM